jgi:YggT family protein
MSLFGFFQRLQIIEPGPASRGLNVIQALFQFVWLLTVGVIVAMILLMLLRFIFNYADLNPFGRPVIFVRRLTDPFVNPVRRALLGFNISPNGAPLVTILLTILLGYFALTLVAGVLNMAAGVYFSLTSGRPGGVVAFLGYLLYGLLTLYSLLIFFRIIFSWGRTTQTNRVGRFLVRVTDPLLVPLRQVVPPLGMFDISPIVAFIIIWLFQAAVAFTLLRNWPLAFVG